MQYFLGKTTERTQALGVTSGVSLGTPIFGLGSVSRDAGILMRAQLVVFLWLFPLHSPDMVGIAWRLAAPAADVGAEQAFTQSLSHAD